MPKTKNSKFYSREKVILIVAWIVSLVLLILCSVLAFTSELSFNQKLIIIVLMQIAGGLFFPISIGKVVQIIRARDNATVLGNFLSNVAQAGLKSYFSSRDDDAREDLAKSFYEHKKGDILLVGASLRLFLSPGADFYKVIGDNIRRYEERGVKIRVINSDMKNRSIPNRAFVEECLLDGKLAQGSSRKKFFDFFDKNFNWGDHISFNLENFYDQFYNDWESKSRIVSELNNVDRGIASLNGMTKGGDVISYRKTICAPYFTGVIFSDKCYITQNILYPEAPASLPMCVYFRGRPVYDKVLIHFKILWWSGIQ